MDMTDSPHLSAEAVIAFRTVSSRLFIQYLRLVTLGLEVTPLIKIIQVVDKNAVAKTIGISTQDRGYSATVTVDSKKIVACLTQPEERANSTKYVIAKLQIRSVKKVSMH
jgi:hypothetical protein